MKPHTGWQVLSAQLSRFLPLVLFLLILSPALAEDLLEMAGRDSAYNEFRLALGAVPNVKDIRDANHQTLLHRAAGCRSQEKVALLLFAGADVNAKDANGRTPMFSVLSTFRPDGGRQVDSFMILEMLTIKGADVNARANDGTTPLAIAAETGDLRAAEFLIWRGASLAPAQVPPDRVPLIIARKRGDQPMIALLQEAALPENATTEKASGRHLADSLKRRFSSAARAADLNSVQSLLAEGADINQQDENGATALWRAANDRRADLVTLLLLEGADPNARNKNGNTPLMAITHYCGMTPQRIFFGLLLAGADVNAVSNEKNTALAQAVNSYVEWAAKWLIWRGADLNFRTPRGSIMQLAMAQVDDPTMLNLLKSFGLKEESVGAMDPTTAAFNAIRVDDKATFAELLRTIPANTTDANGRPLIWCAAIKRHNEMVDMLIARGADINQACPSGWTALHTIICNPNDGQDSWVMEALKEALKRGANPNAAAKDGTTPLMLVAQQGLDSSRMELLLNSGALINARNKKGKTALGLAVEFGRKESAEYLKAHSAEE